MSKKICSIKGCENKVKARGYCEKHYDQLRKHGKIFERTTRDPNEFIEYNNCYGIILRNKNQEKVAEALINKADIKWVKQYKWNYDPSRGYAKTRIGKKLYYLHKLVFPEAIELDHVNRNRLDNRRSNLRKCTRSENMYNSSLRSDNTSGVPGVTWHKKTNKWMVQIWMNTKPIYLGYYNQFNDAVEARKIAEQKYHGKFARN